MLSRTTIFQAFILLSEELAKRDILGELNLLGGTAMVLAFNARAATKDVDAIFQPSRDIREAAAVVALDLGLSSDWLNDAAEGFLSADGDFELLDSFNFSNLRVQAPTPEYMLAMKVLRRAPAWALKEGIQPISLF